ncbi:hypothetical protein ACPPVT_16145 [Angustibacter sp. McL0619]|uniref:hypothetical protein n=1 Tax=Angustibacter sp. McL0619 TaxID=3415676 RepID=UPI003CF1B61F
MAATTLTQLGSGEKQPDGLTGLDARPRLRAVLRVLATVLAGLLVWFALVAPDRVSQLTPLVFARIPVEGLLVVAVALVLPDRPRRVLALLGGALLGVLAVVRVLDMGFYLALGRPFDPLGDWAYFPSAAGLLRESIGRVEAGVFLVVAGGVLLGLLVLLPLSLRRLTELLATHRRASVRALALVAAGWLAATLLGLQLVPGAPLAGAPVTDLAVRHVREVRAGLQDQQAFTRAAAVDPFRSTPAAQLLTGLRGKDVIVAFVESYGRVAIDGSPAAAGVEAGLDAGTRELQGAGFAARSAYLTSPTFGGISWLAHSTLQSGLWVDDQRRYNQLVSGDRLTLSQAFQRAGWRTVADVPSNQGDWPQGRSFYHYDQLYDAANVGYAGPSFSYAAMPDQYTLTEFGRRELTGTHRAPVMAEIDLVSSHTPWAPLPRMVDPADVGDGSVFHGMPEQGQTPDVVWRDPRAVRAAYQQSIQYSMDALVSFVTHQQDPNLVLVVLGDHQPATIVSGQHAGHDVPVSVIARDPAVLDRISGWGWQPGLRPAADAPVWRMDAFRDRFLTAFGS